jgi:palmitoyltransferase ZDHHC1/11
VIPHLEPGMVPSTIDPDAVGRAERANKAKKQVKISAWKLAKLDSNEAMKAAAKVRASSSVLRPIDARRVPGASPGSSCNASMRSSMSAGYSASGTKERGAGMLQSPSYPQSPASQDDYESGTQSGSSRTSPVHIHRPAAPHAQINVPLPPRVPQAPPRPAPAAAPRPPVPATQMSKPTFQSATSYVRENRKVSVVWDQEAARYVSVAPAPTRPVAGNHGRTLVSMNPSSSALPSGQPSERLAYTGQSIFFGGPLLGAAAADPRRNEAVAGVPTETRRNDGTGGERRRTAESFPVFAPGSLEKNPPSNR